MWYCTTKYWRASIHEQGHIEEILSSLKKKKKNPHDSGFCKQVYNFVSVSSFLPASSNPELCSGCGRVSCFLSTILAALHAVVAKAQQNNTRVQAHQTYKYRMRQNECTNERRFSVMFIKWASLSQRFCNSESFAVVALCSRAGSLNMKPN